MVGAKNKRQKSEVLATPEIIIEKQNKKYEDFLKCFYVKIVRGGAWNMVATFMEILKPLLPQL